MRLPLAGVPCDTPPPAHCSIDGCTREQLGNPGNAKVVADVLRMDKGTRKGSSRRSPNHSSR